jgi:plastocyanin
MKGSRRLAIAAAVLACACGLASAGAAQRHMVQMKDFQIQPAELKIKRGESVTWTNSDIVAHTVTATGQFDSGAIGPNASWTHRFDKPGRYAYVCTYHPTMKATVVVE